ncbi:MAG: hypothetical protein H0Z28_01485 [Archaeoglobus sp.]|nr:hypothetical protein [Archaeoglobus sp.]
MVKSYEIVFEDISETKPAEILARSFYREGKECKIDIKRESGKVVIRVRISGKNGNGNGKRFKKIIISRERISECGEDTAIILDYPGKRFHKLGKNVWCINASKIAEKFSCSREFPLLGAIARTGLISLHSLILEIYNDYDKMEAHKRALAVRRGFEGLRV